MLKIAVTHDPKRPVGGRPFFIDSGEVVTTLKLALTTPSIRNAIVEFANAQNSQLRPPGHAEKGSVLVGIVYLFRYRSNPGRHPDLWSQIDLVAKTWVNPAIWSCYIDVTKRKILPDWFTYLRCALAATLPRSDDVIMNGEFLASEGEETLADFISFEDAVKLVSPSYFVTPVHALSFAPVSQTASTLPRDMAKSLRAATNV